MAMLIGCSGSTAVDAGTALRDANCGAPPSLTLGTGTANYERLAEDDDIELIFGPQGGYHLWVTANFALGTSPTGRFIEFIVQREDGATLGTTRVMMSETRLTRTTCGWFRGGDFVVLEAQPADVTNMRVTITTRILESDAREVLRDERHVRIVDLEP